jgi:hypothetical protein
MAERDLWDLLQPTWVDKMGATAWDAPNLPLFEGAPWPTPISVASANGMKQAAPFSGNSEYPWPLAAGVAEFHSRSDCDACSN